MVKASPVQSREAEEEEEEEEEEEVLKLGEADDKKQDTIRLLDSTPHLCRNNHSRHLEDFCHFLNLNV